MLYFAQRQLVRLFEMLWCNRLPRGINMNLGFGKKKCSTKGFSFMAFANSMDSISILHPKN